MESPDLTLWNGDVVGTLKSLPPSSSNLVFADPPFNLKKRYDGSGSDDMPMEEYYAWCNEWIGLAWKSLVPGGSFFLMTIQEHVGRMWRGLEAGGRFRNMIVWKNSSMPVKNRFCVAYQPILWFVKEGGEYTFNYGYEKRTSDAAIPWGRPNKAGSIRDIWEDIPFVSGGCMASKEAIMSPGTKKKKHPCQMPIKLAKRIIGHCSNEGDVVYDLFCGSGTVPHACTLMGRKCVAMEMSKEYCGDIRTRLEAPVFGDEQDKDGGGTGAEVETFLSE